MDSFETFRRGMAKTELYSTVSAAKASAMGTAAKT